MDTTPEFFDLLEKQAGVAQRSAQAFLDLSHSFGNASHLAATVSSLEREGDEFTRKLQRKVLTTFMTPLDKEDLRGLSQSLDDVADAIEATAARISLYRLSECRSALVTMAQNLVEVCGVIESAVGELRNNVHGSKTFEDRLGRIHTLEDQGDSLYREALAELFADSSGDVLMVVKWKEIFDHCETAFDRCEDVAIALETILIKYA